MTGKQAEFIRQYLGVCRFSATAAAKAVYKANSQHSFEEIGRQNLQKPEIRHVIDEHFKLARMDAQEVLIELTRLARGTGKEKLRALALLSQHHGLLDHSWRSDQTEKEIEQRAEELLQRRLDEVIADMQKDVDEYNAKAEKSNKEKERQWQDTIDRYSHAPIAVQALSELRDIMLGKKEPPAPKPQPVEVEIILPIPQQRRLQPAPAERMLAEVIDVEPEPLPQERCKHGCLMHQCRTIEIGNDYCPHHYSLAPKQARSSFRFS